MVVYQKNTYKINAQRVREYQGLQLYKKYHAAAVCKTKATYTCLTCTTCTPYKYYLHSQNCKSIVCHGVYHTAVQPRLVQQYEYTAVVYFILCVRAASYNISIQVQVSVCRLSLSSGKSKLKPTHRRLLCLSVLWARKNIRCRHTLTSTVGGPH